MAYDLMGNYTGPDDTETGYETEEQRRRRLAAEQANAVVHTSTVKTYGDGTREETTKRTVPGPVSPDQVFQRQIQVESGGQHYAPGGGILTSPAGAQGVAQVMPTTAARPGYGIQPATPEEIATPEGNMAFGQRYKQGMLNVFGGDQAKATAAYNAGPGRVQQAEAQAAQQGGSWTDYLPRETMGYLGKVFGGMIPSAAAAEVPPQRQLPPGLVPQPDGTLKLTQMPGQPAAQPAAEPAAAAPSPYVLTAPSGQGLQVPGVPTTPQPEVNPYIKQYQDVQDDIRGLLPLAQDPNAPEWLRNRASERAAELNRNAVEEQRAKAQIANMTPNQVASELRKKGEEGSWVKAILFGVLGMENSQKEEAAKLGIGKWEDSTLTLPDGTDVAVQLKRAANGRILGGTTMDGRELTTDELNIASGGAGKYKPEISSGAYVKKDAEGNVIARGVRTTVVRGNRTITKIESGGKTYDINAGWEPESISTAGAKATQGKQINLAWDPIIKAATTSAEELTKAGIKYGMDLYSPGVGTDGKPIIVDRNTDKIVKPNAQGMVAVPAGGTAALETQTKLGLERGQGVVKAMDEEIRPQAQAGDTVSSVRKQQFAIFDRPGIDTNKLFGIATGAGQSPGDQKWTIVRDIFSGAVASNADGSPMNGQQLSQRLYGLNLSPAELSALAEYNIANQKINAATLKQTAGPGSVSNAEQQANRESNVDITKIPALGAYNAMAQSQFDGDRARYKADWAAGKDFKSTLEMDKAWRKENQQLADMYAERAKERIKYINDNGNTANAVKMGYKLFPVPTYDPTTETWAKRKPMSSYER